MRWYKHSFLKHHSLIKIKTNSFGACVQAVRVQEKRRILDIWVSPNLERPLSITLVQTYFSCLRKQRFLNTISVIPVQLWFWNVWSCQLLCLLFIKFITKTSPQTSQIRTAPLTLVWWQMLEHLVKYKRNNSTSNKYTHDINSSATLVII